MSCTPAKAAFRFRRVAESGRWQSLWLTLALASALTLIPPTASLARTARMMDAPAVGAAPAGAPIEAPPTTRVASDVDTLTEASDTLAVDEPASAAKALSIPRPSSAEASQSSASGLVPVPALSSRVIDQTGTLAELDAQPLRSRIAALEAATGAQIAVLVLSTTGAEPIEPFAHRVFERWKLGRAEADDGVLIVVALADRRLRIEVGQGLEGTIPDLRAARIIDRQMAPRLKDDDLAGALRAGVEAVAARIDNGTGADDDADDSTGFGGLTGEGRSALAMLLGTLLIGVAIGRRWLSWRGTLVAVAITALAASTLSDLPLGQRLTFVGMVTLFLGSFSATLGFGLARFAPARRIAAWLVVAAGVIALAIRFWGGKPVGLVLAGAALTLVFCLLLWAMVQGARTAWRTSRLRLAITLGLALSTIGAIYGQMDPLANGWGAQVAFLAGSFLLLCVGVLFGQPGDSSSGDGSGGGGSWSSGSSSSSSSGSSSGGGGSSSGGGASGSW